MGWRRSIAGCFRKTWDGPRDTSKHAREVGDDRFARSSVQPALKGAPRPILGGRSSLPASPTRRFEQALRKRMVGATRRRATSNAMDCSFRKIARGDLLPDWVDEDEGGRSFLETAPLAPTQALDGPHRCVEFLWEPESAASTTELLVPAARIAREPYGAGLENGWRRIVNTREFGGEKSLFRRDVPGGRPMGRMVSNG